MHTSTQIHYMNVTLTKWLKVRSDLINQLEKSVGHSMPLRVIAKEYPEHYRQICECDAAISKMSNREIAKQIRAARKAK
jgi:hypothetical protein